MDCTTATEAEFNFWLDESVGRRLNFTRSWFAKNLKDRFHARPKLRRLLCSGGWLGRTWHSSLGEQNLPLSEQNFVYRASVYTALPTLANCGDSYGAYRLCEQRLVPICQDLARLHGASGSRMGRTAAPYLRRVLRLCGRYQSCATRRFRQSESGVAWDRH